MYLAQFQSPWRHDTCRGVSRSFEFTRWLWRSSTRLDIVRVAFSYPCLGPWEPWSLGSCPRKHEDVGGVCSGNRKALRSQPRNARIAAKSLGDASGLCHAGDCVDMTTFCVPWRCLPAMLGTAVLEDPPSQGSSFPWETAALRRLQGKCHPREPIYLGYLLPWTGFAHSNPFP